ncbi:MULTISPECIES: cell wall hydrolase [Sphingomonas]|uniref:Cell wall hydrolase n=1 Tax=Edaphosphingomonas fennica TaxID=114404 RepID=A0A2T4HMS3_9SPHN|nr:MULTISPECIES: cell wall hydrolase [Sphingomonas]AGH51273.1 cell wall hydrolase SleB [Sphingomonas sp. MM-1]MDX3884662.1 cell wall hydrolase [Sphingomonas sp.]PTD17078.1 cell wall hydrolase [Sphingomonas fennica]
MSFRASRRQLYISATAAMAMAVPATFGFASETSLAATVSAAFPAIVAEETAPAIVADAPGEAVEAPALSLDIPARDTRAATTATASAERIDDPELECMAKVVHHEAANQSRAGQLAVAQLIMNRLESGRFADTVCGVAHQPGQFFNTNTYNPRRTTAQWRTAVEVSREAMAGKAPDVMPGALFYHASYQAPPRFFRTRERAGVLGDHIFYR